MTRTVTFPTGTELEITPKVINNINLVEFKVNFEPDNSMVIPLSIPAAEKVIEDIKSALGVLKGNTYED
jgi:hypothetical protein